MDRHVVQKAQQALAALAKGGSQKSRLTEARQHLSEARTHFMFAGEEDAAESAQEVKESLDEVAAKRSDEKLPEVSLKVCVAIESIFEAAAEDEKAADGKPRIKVKVKSKGRNRKA